MPACGRPVIIREKLPISGTGGGWMSESPKLREVSSNKKREKVGEYEKWEFKKKLGRR